MGPSDWMTGGATLGMLLISLGAAALAQGAHRQRTDSLAGDLTALGERVTALEALKVSVEGLTRGIEHLSERLVESQRLYGAELARLADQVVAGQRLIDARFDALKELSARELDEVKHGIRNIRQVLEGRPPPRERSRVGPPESR